MTDNRTTELREKLTERGIEYTTNDHMGVCETSWNGFTAMQLTPSAKLMMAVTPEQAVAATLGSEYHGYEQAAIEAWESIKAWNTRAAHGTLTAEQVREAIEANSWAETSTIREFNDSSWQAIADELNGELGSGACEIECFDDGVDEGMDGEWFSYAPPTWYLSCGHTAQGTEMPNFCPNCGARIRKAVER